MVGMLFFTRSRRRSPRLPAHLAGLLGDESRVLGAVPLDAVGDPWAVATGGEVCVVAADGVRTRRPWHEVARGTWDAQSHTFTLTWIDGAPELVLPVRRLEAGRRVDVAPFARAMRQLVESALVHSASDTLPSGLRVTVSARRGGDGQLYVVTTPPGAGVDEADREALRTLRRRVCDGVGLPTS